VSGYLHRLVSSAMRPAMRVHPLVDEQATDDEILSQGKAAVRLDSSSLIQARARFTPATQWHTRSTADESVEPNRNNLVHEPLLTSDVPVAPATRRCSEEPPSPSSRLTGRADPRHESAHRPLPQHLQQGDAEPARPAVPKHEPDEIQITIGRIEVTAVPDAPRPVPKPARKQLSLEDYLKQADARGR
jgi:hypothetical protein